MTNTIVGTLAQLLNIKASDQEVEMEVLHP
jgi:hypothetical protein